VTRQGPPGHSEPIDWSQLWYPARGAFTDADWHGPAATAQPRADGGAGHQPRHLGAMLQAAPQAWPGSRPSWPDGGGGADGARRVASAHATGLLRRTLAVLGMFQLLVLGIM
jgi:hypothetical protein